MVCADDRAKVHYPGISALRAIAALLVVLQHSIFYAGPAAGIDALPYLKAGFGQYGVVLFFCISGFVIGLNRHTPTRRFLFRRFLRIYPPFWLAMALALLLQPNAHLDAAAVTLWPTTELNVSLNIPYWTLIFEMAFYVLAAGVFALRLPDRTLAMIAALWILVVQVLGNYFRDEMFIMTPGPFVLASPYVQAFACGLLACLLKDRLTCEPLWLIVGAIAAFMLPSAIAWPPAGYLAMFSVSGALIVTAAARATSCPAPLSLLGNASYGVYLLHLPLLVFGADLLAPLALPFQLAWALLACGAILGSVTFGLAEHAIHEKLVAATKATLDT